MIYVIPILPIPNISSSTSTNVKLSKLLRFDLHLTNLPSSDLTLTLTSVIQIIRDPKGIPKICKLTC